MPGRLKRIVPRPIWFRLTRIWESSPVRRLRYVGLANYCPICRSHVRRFIDYGTIDVLKGEECPFCGSHRRHRMMWMFLNANRAQLFGKPSMRLLDIAPLRHFHEIFTREMHIEYLSADLNSPLAMVKMDLTNISYAEQSFDAIYCSHVLEHIPDDRKAMAELFRVLKIGGWAILQVPLDRNRETTYEDPSIQTPEERARAFGQADHLRWYGRDYKDRLESAGFTVTIDKFVTTIPDRTVRKYGLDRNEDIYFCERLT